VYLLLLGAAASAYFHEYIEALAILGVIAINALIGFFMEMQARHSMEALKKMDVIVSKVLRDGKTKEIASEKITLGDVVLLESGDVVPGDGRLIESNQLQCDESSLTGESLPSFKKIEKILEDAVLGDRNNMVFKGTSITNGNGRAVVTGIGKNTELGTISALVEEQKEHATPLDKQLSALSKKLIYLIIGLTIIFATTGFVQGKDWLLIVETSIALAVAAIPEGLPIVATVALAYGMLLMAKRNAIVKKLSSVETLGSTNVILTDKTGTLTENKIYVDTFSFPEEKRQVRIENDVLIFDNGEIEKSEKNFEKLRLVGALCNNATIEEIENELKACGDPIEIALIHLANASNSSHKEILEQYQRLAEIPFSSETKTMAVLYTDGEKEIVAAKGSVEDLLEKCSHIQMGENILDFSQKEKTNILTESEKMASKGLRVLAFGYREGNEIDKEDFLAELIYVGMIGFLDPPRMEIKNAIVSCKNAGIKIVMITGDHPQTALNIAQRIGLIQDGEESVIAGKELPQANALTPEWINKILSTSIFARTTPQQKLDIAHVYQQAGNIVAMTGDGVNDAPALKKADIGIAMGLRGTQVAKETACIILKDDSFTSIAEAVAHGRSIFQNIQKFVVYLISCNMTEILIVTGLGFLAPNANLLPLQILFLNMVTDVFPALALGVGKSDENVMKKPPRAPNEQLLKKGSWLKIGLYSTTMTLAVILAVFYCKNTIQDDHRLANNVAFVTLTLSQLFHVFNMSSMRSGVWKNEITRNKFVWLSLLVCIGLLALVYSWHETRLILKLDLLPKEAWAACILASISPLILIQTYKAIRKAVL
jgi:Ca2+-transporting ATPase